MTQMSNKSKTNKIFCHYLRKIVNYCVSEALDSHITLAPYLKYNNKYLEYPRLISDFAVKEHYGRLGGLYKVQGSNLVDNIQGKWPTCSTISPALSNIY